MLWKCLIYAALLNFLKTFVLSTDVSEANITLIPCDEGWLHFQGKCYRVYDRENGTTWLEAANNCQGVEGHLVGIHSKEELDFLVSNIILDIKSNVWIGFHDRSNESEFSWHDGSPVNYTNWKRDEPSGIGEHGEEDCVEMVFRNFRFEANAIGKWDDKSCSNKKNPYICQTKADPEKKTPDPQFCSPNDGGGWKYETSCYHVVSEQHTWNKAEEYCRGNFNGHLVTVLDSTVDFYLNHILSDLGEAVWIGIKIRDQFQQKWASGWHVSYDADFGKRYGDFKEGFCILRNKCKDWTMAPCSETHPFVCETSKDVSPVLKPAMKGYRCPTEFSDWRDLDGKFCYYIETERKRNWFDANAECERRGGHLASIHSEEENKILHPFVKYTQEAAFIGLSRSPTNRDVIRWVDGTVMNYSNWDDQQPDDRAGVETCGEVWKLWMPTMKWNDQECIYNQGFICSTKKVPLTTVERNASSSNSSVPPDVKDRNNVSGRLSVGARISIAVTVILLLVFLGTALYFLRPWDKRNQLHFCWRVPPPVPTSVRPNLNIRTTSTLEEEEHIYEPIDYCHFVFRNGLEQKNKNDLWSIEIITHSHSTNPSKQNSLKNQTEFVEGEDGQTYEVLNRINPDGDQLFDKSIEFIHQLPQIPYDAYPKHSKQKKITVQDIEKSREQGSFEPRIKQSFKPCIQIPNMLFFIPNHPSTNPHPKRFNQTEFIDQNDKSYQQTDYFKRRDDHHREPTIQNSKQPYKINIHSSKINSSKPSIQRVFTEEEDESSYIEKTTSLSQNPNHTGFIVENKLFEKLNDSCLNRRFEPSIKKAKSMSQILTHHHPVRSSKTKFTEKEEDVSYELMGGFEQWDNQPYELMIENGKTLPQTTIQFSVKDYPRQQTNRELSEQEDDNVYLPMGFLESWDNQSFRTSLNKANSLPRISTRISTYHQPLRKSQKLFIEQKNDNSYESMGAFKP